MKQFTQILSMFAKISETSNAIQRSASHKEKTMKSRSLTSTCGRVTVILMMLCFNVVSVFGQSAPGYSGNALSFRPGGTHIEIPHIEEYTADDIRLEAWVYPDQFSGVQMIIALRVRV